MLLTSQLQVLDQAYALPAHQGYLNTSMRGVKFFRATKPVRRAPLLYQAGLVIIGQGHKVGYLAGERFYYGPGTYFIASVPVPFECETHASADTPLLGIFIDVSVAALHKVVTEMQDALLAPHLDISDLPRGYTPAPLGERMAEAVARLLRCLCDPVECRVLGSAIVSEILYHALLGPHGAALHALTIQHTPYARIARALTFIHKHYAESCRIDDLAREAAMSTSTFHRAFKRVTGQTPLLYVKILRLDKARSLIVHQGMGVGAAADEVGYKSQSQFSREFKQHFGLPPSEAHELGYAEL